MNALTSSATLTGLKDHKGRKTTLKDYSGASLGKSTIKSFMNVNTWCLSGANHWLHSGVGRSDYTFAEHIYMSLQSSGKKNIWTDKPG